MSANSMNSLCSHAKHALEKKANSTGKVYQRDTNHAMVSSPIYQFTAGYGVDFIIRRATRAGAGVLASSFAQPCEQGTYWQLEPKLHRRF